MGIIGPWLALLCLVFAVFLYLLVLGSTGKIDLDYKGVVSVNGRNYEARVTERGDNLSSYRMIFLSDPDTGSPVINGTYDKNHPIYNFFEKENNGWNKLCLSSNHIDADKPFTDDVCAHREKGVWKFGSGTFGETIDLDKKFEISDSKLQTIVHDLDVAYTQLKKRYEAANR